MRIDDDDWEDLGACADAMDIDRAWIIRQLVRLYLRRPGSQMPVLPGARLPGGDRPDS